METWPDDIFAALKANHIRHVAYVPDATMNALTDVTDGTYLTLEQSAYSTRIAQGALFGFD